MIAQLRTNIKIGFGSFGGPDEDVIGGKALKYY
jgi:RecA/RadA recombinase